MDGATEWQKATMVVKFLKALCMELVMPQFGSKCRTYLDAREAAITCFGGEAFLASRKDAFMRIKFKENESIDEFADQFNYDAQILKGCGMLNTFDTKLALKYALEPYPQLSIAMVQPLIDDNPIPDLVEI